MRRGEIWTAAGGKDYAGNAVVLQVPNKASIRCALEAAGIEFIENNGGGEGVRFKKSQKHKKLR